MLDIGMIKFCNRLIFLTGWVCAICWNTMCYKTVCLIWNILFCNLLICRVLHGPTCLVAIGHRMHCLSWLSALLVPSWLSIFLVCPSFCFDCLSVSLSCPSALVVFCDVQLLKTGWVLVIYWNAVCYKIVCLVWNILFCNLLTDSVLRGPTFLVAIGHRMHCLSFPSALLDYQSFLSVHLSVLIVCLSVFFSRLLWWSGRFCGWWFPIQDGVFVICWSTVRYKTVCLIWSMLFCNLLICSALCGPTFLVAIGPSLHIDYSVRHIGFAAVWLVWCSLFK